MALFDDFGDADDYVDDLVTKPIITSKTTPSADALPEIPKGNALSVHQLEHKKIATRKDKPVAYVPKVKPAPQKATEQAVEPSTAAPLPINNIKKTVISSERTGSINKISTPAMTAPVSIVKKEPVQQDAELLAMAGEYDVFSLKQVADYQIVSPTSAEFIAQYYRLINNMTTKVTLNQMVSTPTVVKGLWHDGATSETLNISGNTTFSYDELYRYCVQDTSINLLRRMYENKRLAFTDMQTHQIMGAGHGISSAQQATYYLEKTATSIFSNTISVLIFRSNMLKVRDWFENALPLNNDTKKAIMALVQDAVIDSSKAQAIKYEDNDDVFVTADHHCILFAKKLLNRHGNLQLSNNHLHITALAFLMSGIPMQNPNVANLGFKTLFEGLKESQPLRDSLVRLSYEGHRHCYPINELSHL